MEKSLMVNHLRSGLVNMFFISHIIEVLFVIFAADFLLGPAVGFIINGLFCGFLFMRPHLTPLLGSYKRIFRLSDDDFYMHELKLNFWFWSGRTVMAIIVVGQIAAGIYFLSRYGFLNQNLIYLLRNS